MVLPGAADPPVGPPAWRPAGIRQHDGGVASGRSAADRRPGGASHALEPGGGDIADVHRAARRTGSPGRRGRQRRGTSGSPGERERGRRRHRGTQSVGPVNVRTHHHHSRRSWHASRTSDSRPTGRHSRSAVPRRPAPRANRWPGGSSPGPGKRTSPGGWREWTDRYSRRTAGCWRSQGAMATSGCTRRGVVSRARLPDTPARRSCPWPSRVTAGSWPRDARTRAFRSGRPRPARQWPSSAITTVRSCLSTSAWTDGPWSAVSGRACSGRGGPLQAARGGSYPGWSTRSRGPACRPTASCWRRGRAISPSRSGTSLRAGR